MTDIALQSAPPSRSAVASLMVGLVALCAIIPYALVALGLRLLMARVFFLLGQANIEGLTVHIDLKANNLDFTVILPTQVKATALQVFAGKYAALPIPTDVTAYLFTYAEFLLPACLVIGFATRFSALLLLIMTVLMAIYATLETFAITQVYWVAILLVLVSVGPGALSIDGLIRHLYTRDRAPDFL
jgi:putative oxidoreductase